MLKILVFCIKYYKIIWHLLDQDTPVNTLSIIINGYFALMQYTLRINNINEPLVWGEFNRIAEQVVFLYLKENFRKLYSRKLSVYENKFQPGV